MRLPFTLMPLDWFMPGRVQDLAARARRAMRLIILSVIFLCLLLSVSMLMVQRGLTDLVDSRLAPMSELERVISGYDRSVAVAQKVRTGNLTAQGGLSALENEQRDIAAGWRALAATSPSGDDDRWRVLHEERQRADAALTELAVLIAGEDADRLDFYLSGPVYSRVDPFMLAGRAYMADLRRMAERERRSFHIMAAMTLAMPCCAPRWAGRCCWGTGSCASPRTTSSVPCRT